VYAYLQYAQRYYRNELERTRGDLVACGCHAHHTALTPAAMRTLQRRSHHLHVARSVEGVVHTPLGLLHDESLHGSALGEALRINAICAPELLGYGELGSVHVDAEDTCGSSHFCSLHDGEPDCAETKHCDGRARLDVASVPCGSQSG